MDNVDTTVFNNTTLTSTNLTLGTSDTQVDGANTIVSTIAINFKKK